MLPLKLEMPRSHVQASSKLTIEPQVEIISMNVIGMSEVSLQLVEGCPDLHIFSCARYCHSAPMRNVSGNDQFCRDERFLNSKAKLQHAPMAASWSHLVLQVQLPGVWFRCIRGSASRKSINGCCSEGIWV